MNRRYDLDWLRVIAFGILMLFHTGMGFTSYDWHVKNYESSRLIDELIQFVHQWRMPLLFFISGAAVWFAMEKYSTWRYLGERQKRLLLPLIFGMLVIIPPQVYCERVYQREGYSSFFDFYPTIFTSGSYPQGNLSWHHLWYIPYIWAFSMITFPLFAWFKSASGRAVIGTIQNLFTRPGMLFLIFIPSTLAEILLRPFYPGDYNNLSSDWANFTHKLTFFVIGFVLASGTGLADVIAARRRHFLTAAVVSLVALEAIWKTHFRIPTPAYHCLSNFHTWMWVLTALGFGRQYLNVNSPALRYATNAVYPFYILHQTVIVMVLLPLVYVDLGLWPKYFIVLGGTALITWGLHEGLISRVSVLRVCFGLKARRGQRSATSAGVADTRPTDVQSGRGLAVSPGSGPVIASMLVACGMLAFSTSAAGAGKLAPVLIAAPSLANNRLGIAETQPVAIYLPPSYGSTNRRYPVIYLLPNFNTPVWRYTAGNYQGFRLRQAADQLIAAGTMPETIIVVPNTMHFLGGSWYRNSTLTGNWEDYISRDLTLYVDGRYRTIPRREARGLGGHGVGGTGALELALKHPDVFGAVYAMSPALLSPEDLRSFTVDADRQAASWRALTARLSPLTAQEALRGFRVYMQEHLNTSSPGTLFEGLRVSYVAAVAPATAVFPYIDYPSADTREADRQKFWAEIMGNWEEKVRAYLGRPEQLGRITIEYGRRDEYDFIRRGAEHVSQLMRSLGVPNTLTVSEGGHDSTLGRRLEHSMLPVLGSALKASE